MLLPGSSAHSIGICTRADTRPAGRSVRFRTQLPQRGDPAPQEKRFVQSPTTHPRGDLTVALARIAGATGRNDILDRVAAATRDRQYAVLLERRVDGSAVGTRLPCVEDPEPLLRRQVAPRRRDPSRPPTCRPRLPRLSYRHVSTLLMRRAWSGSDAALHPAPVSALFTRASPYRARWRQNERAALARRVHRRGRS